MVRLPHPAPDPIAAGQESVWDFPRPAIAQSVSNHLVVMFAGRVLAETRRGVRTIETSHPPTYYFPPDDIDLDMLVRNARHSFCEWKGQADYFDVVAGDRRANAAAWAYPRPSAPFRDLADHVAFYPQAMDECRVDGERVMPQPGGFYGGWITAAVAGPFKGIPGSEYW